MTQLEPNAPTASDPKLRAKLAAHPSVQAVLARRRAGEVASPPAVIDAVLLRELCLAAGADDAAAVSLDHADLASEREHVLAALPGTRSLIAMVFRMNRDNCRSPARSVANQEFQQTDQQANHAARSVAKRCRTPAIARSIRQSVSPRRWTASPGGSRWWRTRRPPWLRDSASWVCTATSSTRSSAASCCWPPCWWTQR